MGKIIGATFRASVLALFVFTSEVPYSDAAGESNFVTYPTEPGAKPFGNADPSTNAPASGHVARHPPKESRAVNNNFVSYPAAALGTSNDSNYYNYVHTSPLTGINYYRILQTDSDNRSSYSAIRTLKFTTNDESFLLIDNPVTNQVLRVQVNMAGVFALYTADGKMLWQQQLNAGTKTFDVSRYAKGIYLLKSNNTTRKIVIQ